MCPAVTHCVSVCVFCFVKIFFFLCGPFLKSLLNLLQYCFCFPFRFPGQEAHGILVPRQGIEPAPPALKGGVSTTGPPGRVAVTHGLPQTVSTFRYGRWSSSRQSQDTEETWGFARKEGILASCPCVSVCVHITTQLVHKGSRAHHKISRG